MTFVPIRPDIREQWVKKWRDLPVISTGQFPKPMAQKDMQLLSLGDEMVAKARASKVQQTSEQIFPKNIGTI